MTRKQWSVLPVNEVWQVPKKAVSTSIQVGNLQIPTGNDFTCLEDQILLGEGGDLIPSSEK